MKSFKSCLKRMLVLVILLLLFVPCVSASDMETVAPETVGISSERLARIDMFFDNIVKDQVMKGAVVRMSRNSKVVYNKAFGGMDDGKAMREDAIFRICSMSKPITAVAMMILWERGLFNLDDPLYKFIPEFKDVEVLVMDKSQEKGYRLEPVKNPITIRHLLSHTSGISYGFFSQPVISQCYLDHDISDGFRVTKGTIGEMTKRLATCPLVLQPGTGWQYGLNFDVLGHVVEVISGTPFDQFLQEKIFDPLKMKDTSFFVPKEKLDQLAALYSPTPEGTLQKLDHQVASRGLITDIPSMVYDAEFSFKGPKTYFSGGAGLHSTAADYMRFCQMMLNGGILDGKRILSPITVKLMTQNHIGEHNLDIYPPGVKYGLGYAVVVDKVMSGSVTPEGTYSWSGVYNTNFYIDPRHNIIASYYSQLMPSFHVMGLSQTFRILTQTAITEE